VASQVQRTMLELLNQLDGFEASNKIKVLCQPSQSTR
jgi:ATP-dependent 26S proteasome regulatory subunit